MSQITQQQPPFSDSVVEELAIMNTRLSQLQDEVQDQSQEQQDQEVPARQFALRQESVGPLPAAAMDHVPAAVRATFHPASRDAGKREEEFVALVQPFRRTTMHQMSLS